MKRIVSFVFSVILVFCLMTDLSINSYARDVSGNCGKNVKWSYSSSNKYLTITGRGAMKNFTSRSEQPWFDFSIKTVEICNGVTSIGSNAFNSCSELTSVKVPMSVTRIGAYAFSACKNLSCINEMSGVTHIDDWAFAGPNSLKTLSFSAVKSVGYYSFNKCSSLKRINLPASGTYIHSYAFGGCSSLDRLSIPGYQSIGEHVFDGCTNLKVIAIPSSIGATHIGNAFPGATNLTDIYYEGNESQWNNVLKSAPNLKNITVHYQSFLPAEPVTQTTYNPEQNNSAGFKSITFPCYCDYIKNTEVGITWHNNMFSHSSLQYSNDIDVLGAALSWAAEGKDEKDGDYISYAFLKLGVEPSKIFLFSYPGSSNNVDFSYSKYPTLAFSIASKEVTDTNGNNYSLIFIVARGTMSFWEAVFDVTQGENKNVLGYKTYEYYTEFYEKILEGLKFYTLNNPGLLKKNVKILVTGHSLGGAAANLVAADLTKNIGKFSLNYTQKDIFGYTYGAVSPLVKQSDGVSYGFENIFNTFNKIDTYGPNGAGDPGHVSKIEMGSKPKGSDNYKKKFGKMRTFTYYFTEFHNASKNKAGLSTANHDMTGYMSAVQNRFADNRNYGGVYCPVDIEIKSEGKTVYRITNNIIDESVTSIPCSVINDAKFFTLDKETAYEITYTATDNGFMSTNYGNTIDDESTKEFNDIQLFKGKKMLLDVKEGEAINDYSLYVVDESNHKTAEINEDGSEKQVEKENGLSFWQRIIQWFKTLFSKIFKK